MADTPALISFSDRTVMAERLADLPEAALARAIAERGAGPARALMYGMALMEAKT